MIWARLFSGESVDSPALGDEGDNFGNPPYTLPWKDFGRRCQESVGVRLRGASLLVVSVASVSFPVNFASAAFVPVSTRSAVSSLSRVSGRETADFRLIGVPPGESFCGERERARSAGVVHHQPTIGSGELDIDRIFKK